VDVRLTAEDGYRVERSYSIASPPEEHHRVTLTVERLDDGEVSPYLTEELRVGDGLELRGPIGGYARLGCSDGWTAPAGRRGIGHCATHGYAPSPRCRGQHRSSSFVLFVAFL
jgi:NAD(P)H-flavin reductase